MRDLFFKIIRKVVLSLKRNYKEPPLREWKKFSNKSYSNRLIYEKLVSSKPCMIGRIGSTEMLTLTNYIGIKRNNIFQYFTGESFSFWWQKYTKKQMENWSGFYPATDKNLIKFSELMFNDMEQVDILGSWLTNEKYLKKSLSNAKQLVLEDLEPFFTDNPWTKALEGKKVLVIHPFNELIEKQYKKRKELFLNNLLPEFELVTIKAVQSLGGNNSEFKDWFQALDFMKKEIDKIDFDICIVGAGAYGFPLAAHVKRIGKKSIHLGGITQILFGIIGKRWEEFIVWPYSNMFNDAWVRPGELLKPKNADQVEGACYW